MARKRWEDVKKSFVGPLTETEIDHIEFVAMMVAEIRQRREELGWTQEQLANRAGIPQSAVARLENGGVIPRLDTLFKVIRPLGLEFKLIIANEEAASAVF
jgi:transcriptional regulator with XRE-family HTH domain